MIDIQPHSYRLVSQDDDDKHFNSQYDEERLNCSVAPCWERRRTCLRIKRPRKSTILLLLLDVLIVVLLVHTLEPLITLLQRNEELFEPRVSFQGTDGLNDLHEVNGTKRIPRILHQTAATDVIPDKWVESQKSCKEAYGDFEYKLWTDASTRDFLSENYPWFVDVWDNYAFPIQRADSLRYFILYHYGGIYLDMDTWCNRSVPIDRLETDHEYALFKATKPTGVTNDFMITTARHPVYAAAIAKLPAYNSITRAWARWQPYSAIMIASGPMFLTLVAKDYLLQHSPIPSPTIGVVNATELNPFIMDLESATWHQADAKALMWLGTRPWTWFTMGAVVLGLYLYVLNRVLMALFEFMLCKTSFGLGNLKLTKGWWKLKR
ncbi:hypothetical protein N7523_002845 [Penicillium sp. IBT 18751x]|nr:hypothetical protein N7523_002845 [Penicillium sp. IBT 18751x]